MNLIEKALDILDSSLDKINKGDNKDKAYYNGIKNEAIAAADAIYNQLREIVGAK